MKLQDARRQNNVTKLAEILKKHQHKEQFLKDMSQKQEINRFSEESQKLLEDMNQTEIFEFCENSAKLQCSDSNSFSDIGIIYCRRGRNLKNSRSPTTLQKTIAILLQSLASSLRSIPVKGPKHGQSERLIMFHRVEQMLKKARQAEHANHPTILSRWYEQEGYRTSLTEHNIGEKEIMLYDRIALERHDFSAARANIWFFV